MKKMIVALIASAAAMTVAHAEGNSYVGVDVTRSSTHYDIANAGAATSMSGHTVSGKLFGGYEFDKNWGIEGGYADFGNSSANYTLGTTSGTVKSNGHAFYAAGKGTYAVNDQFSLFSKLGVARSHVSDSITGVATASGSTDKTGVYLGLGAQYNINKQVAIVMELERYGKNAIANTKPVVQNANTLSLGARFSF